MKIILEEEDLIRIVRLHYGGQYTIENAKFEVGSDKKFDGTIRLTANVKDKQVVSKLAEIDLFEGNRG